MASMPDLLVIGAQKAATSTIFEALRAHPDVQVARDPPSGNTTKEVHFFDNAWARGESWYGSHYAESAGRGIDATPNYLSSLKAHARMGALLPEAKLVVSLRSPIERAYSQYNHYKQDLPRSRAWDWLRPDDDFRNNIAAELELGSPLEPKYRGFVARGYYIDQIESLLQYYPREQLHIMVMEQWTKQPEAAVDELLDFLGLRRRALPVGTAHRRAYTVETIERETHTLLQRTYEPYNSRLFALLGRTVEEWGARPPNESGAQLRARRKRV